MTVKRKLPVEPFSAPNLDLEDLLRAFKIKGILTAAVLRQLIEQIEEKDRMQVKAKDQILKD
jgi:hypothetical protein